MAIVSDLTKTPVTGFNGFDHIDALLDVGPDWNYLTAGSGNTIHYTFATGSGNEEGKSGQETFTSAQQVAARTAFSYLQQITGIQFVETAIGSNAQIHLCNIDLEGSGTTGLCSWNAPYSYNPSNDTIVDYKVNAYVYLDNVEWRAQNRDLSPGGHGYQTLLHELGHALGLKHPFEDGVQLPDAEDHTANTLMSYNDRGGPYSQFSPYDLAALKWLYGGDGLGGKLGVNGSEGYYLTGTSANETLNGSADDDTLAGGGGTDVILGNGGQDTVVFDGAFSSYTLTEMAGGGLLVKGTSGSVNLSGVELLQFSDRSIERAAVADTQAPAAPALAVTKNAAGFAAGNKPLVSGQAEANAVVRVYHGETLIGETRTDGSGIWSVVSTLAFADGLNYSVYATATDAAGNVSARSGSASFNIDAHAPAVPTVSISLAPSGNQPVFSGNAEAGTTIQLFRTGDFIEIGRTTVGADGRWLLSSNPLPNGNYEVSIASVDKADNATSGAARLPMTISSPANQAGGAGNDSFTMVSGNNAIDGGAGVDVALFSGARADYTVARGVWGYTVQDEVGAGGTDTLIDVERVQFSDGWKALDINGGAGQAFRLYQAAFDRPAEAAGLGYWIWRMDGGSSLLQIAEEFTRQPEFDAKYGLNPTDSDFIKMLYRNVLNREAEGGGYDYWMQRIETSSRAQILTEFSESFENQANVIVTIGTGMDYVPWA